MSDGHDPNIAPAITWVMVLEEHRKRALRPTAHRGLGMNNPGIRVCDWVGSLLGRSTSNLVHGYSLPEMCVGGFQVKQKTEEELRQEVGQRMREIELLRQQAQERGLEFVALSEDELRAKLAGGSTQSPYFYGAGYNSGASPGGTFMYDVAIANPDPTGYLLLVTIFFGMANFMSDISFAPANRNPEWPYLSSRPFVLAGGSTTSQTFTLQAPTSVPLGTYTGNVVLWRPQFFDQGVFLDRGYFDVTLQ